MLYIVTFWVSLKYNASASLADISDIEMRILQRYEGRVKFPPLKNVEDTAKSKVSGPLRSTKLPPNVS